LIDLFAREHFIAHKLLSIEHPDNKSLVFAWTCMAFPSSEVQNRYELSPEEYEEARKAISNAMSGRVVSEETKKKLSESKKGKPLSDDTRNKLSKALHGRVMTEEHRKNISKALQGRIFSDEHKDNISKSKTGKPLSDAQKAALKIVCENNKGRKHSEESKAKISAASKGKELSQETREKLSKAHKGKRNKSHCIKVAQYDLSTENLIKEWECITDASIATGVDNSAISKCAKGQRQHAGGFVWKFI
jgi:plasmid stability protein